MTANNREIEKFIENKYHKTKVSVNDFLIDDLNLSEQEIKSLIRYIFSIRLNDAMKKKVDLSQDIRLNYSKSGVNEKLLEDFGGIVDSVGADGEIPMFFVKDKFRVRGIIYFADKINDMHSMIEDMRNVTQGFARKFGL